MKAAVVTKPNRVECRDVSTPQPQPGQVLVKVAYCGICGSDVSRVLFGTAHSYPIVLGHEFSGFVSEIGVGVDSSMLGKRVAGIPLIPCMKCRDCEAGNFSLCSHYSFIGSRQPGAFAEYVAVPERNVFEVREDVDLLQASFFEPATVAMHAVNLSGFEEGSTAVVVGCGTIGIFLAQALRARGASKIVALGRREERLAIARLAGVEEVLSTSFLGWKERILREDTAFGFDYVFDASGNANAMVDSFNLASNKGTICMVGTPKSEMVFPVRDWENLNRRELRVIGSWMSYSDPWPGSEWGEVEQLFHSGSLKVIPEMIGNIYPLEEVGRAFSCYENGNSASGKLIVKMPN